MNSVLMLAWMVFVDTAFIFYLIALVKSFSEAYKRDHAHYFIALDMQGGWRRIFHRSERVKAPRMVVLVWAASRLSRGRRIFSIVWMAMALAASGFQIVDQIEKLFH